MRVCFVGNSLTHCNHLSLMVRAIAAAHGQTMAITALTPGGQTFEGHCATKGDIATLRGGAWDAVVLQEQSQRPVDEPEPFLHFGAELTKHTGSARLICYQTWAPVHRPELWVGLANAYDELASRICAEVAPAGQAWQALLTDWPEAPLYVEDGLHPEILGSWLAAVVITHTLCAADPEQAPAQLSDGELLLCNLDEAQAARARSAACAAIAARRS